MSEHERVGHGNQLKTRNCILLHCWRYRLKHRKLIFSLILIVLATLMIIPSTLAETAHARFRSVKDIDWPVSFSTDWTNSSGRQYQQPLAQASLGMALSAFRVPEVALANRGNHIEQFLTELDFGKVTLEQYDVEPSIQTIATAIAMRKVTEALTPYTLISVAVSGGGYQNEWESNFLIGTGLHHEGFDYAAKQVYQRIQDYIQAQQIDGAIKIWLTGYSRGAAVANRTAAILLDNRILTADQLFCYTFATPNVTRQQDASQYPSIFNLVGSFDPVPMIPFEEWGYTRYGATYYLPSSEVDSDYADRVQPVDQLYQQMTGEPYWTNQSDNRLLQSLLGTVKDMVSDFSEYAENYQQPLIELWDNHGSSSVIASILGGALLSGNSVWQGLTNASDSILTLLSNAAQELLLQDVGALKPTWSATANLGENLLHEHYPNGYFAWVMAYDTRDAMITTHRRYRQILLGGDARVQILNQADQEVCALEIVDGLPTSSQNAIGFAITKNGDATTIAIPADAEYRITVSPTTQDEVTFAVKEGQSGSTQTDSYQIDDQALSMDEMYTCELPTAFAADGVQYALRSSTDGLVCRSVDDHNALTGLVVNSTAKQMMVENLWILLIILLLILLEVVILIVLSLKATKRHRHLRTVRNDSAKPLKVQNLRPLRFYRHHRAWNVLKTLAWMLVLCAAVMLVQGVQMLESWIFDLQTIDQMTILWFVSLLDLPTTILPILSVFPAMIAAQYLLQWGQEDTYRLKAASLFALFTVPSVGALAWLLATDRYIGYLDTMMWVAIGELLILLGTFVSCRFIIRMLQKQPDKII